MKVTLRKKDDLTTLSFRVKVRNMLVAANSLGINIKEWKVEKTNFSTYKNKSRAPIRRDVTLHTFKNGAEILYLGDSLWHIVGNEQAVTEVLSNLNLSSE